MLVSISLVKIDSSSLCECLNCCTCSSHDFSVGCATDKGLALKKAWNSSSHGHHGCNHVCVCWLCWSCYQFYSTLWYGSVELAIRRWRCEISKLTWPSKAVASVFIRTRSSIFIAFDLIDHHVLAQKLFSYDFPKWIMCWILHFVTNRRQRVKLSSDCVWEWRAVQAGVPQGTKVGPWLFLIMIKDLSVANASIWKYVDDNTLAECVE